MCLVGFASLQSPWAHTLKASLPCLPLPLHRILSPSTHCKRTIIPRPAPTPLPLNERSVGFASALSPRPAPTLPNPHYPLLRTTSLPPLEKGEVLSPEKIRATTRGIALHPPTFPKSHYHLLCTTTLASLVKGRWIDGKAQALILLLSVCDTPTFFLFIKLFCRQYGGIAQQPFAPHNLPKPHYPSKSTISLPPLSKVRCCRPKKFGRQHLTFDKGGKDIVLFEG